MRMATRLDMMVKYNKEGPVHKATWSSNDLILWGQVKN